MKVLVAIPVYNEEKHVAGVLAEVRKYSSDIVVVNDGSSDGTGEILALEKDLTILTHERNRGYGAALTTVFTYALHSGADVLVTMDCDGQHEPSRVPVLVEAIHDADVVSGSRYLRDFRQTTLPTPKGRMHINQTITRELNEQLGLNLTDAFCGFKAYRREALFRLHPTETGWGMPLQVWVQAACHCLRIKEVGVPRIYLDPNRTFGVLNEDGPRLAYYRQVIAEALAAESDCCAAFKKRVASVTRG